MTLTQAEIKRRVKALNRHYRKKVVRKDFGVHGIFEGHITDCWMTPSGREFAHIQYADGDEEDVSITKVQSLLVEPLPPMPPSCPRRIPRLTQAAASSHRRSNSSYSDGDGRSKKKHKEDREEAIELDGDREDELELRSCTATAGERGGGAASSAFDPPAAAAGKTAIPAPRAASTADGGNGKKDGGGAETAAAEAAAAIAPPVLSPEFVNAESGGGTNASVMETVAGGVRRKPSKEEEGKKSKVVVKEVGVTKEFKAEEQQEEAEVGEGMKEEEGDRKMPQLPSSSSSSSSKTKPAGLVGCRGLPLKPAFSTLNSYNVRSPPPPSRLSSHTPTPMVSTREGGGGSRGGDKEVAKGETGDCVGGGGREGGAGTARELAPFKHLVGSVVLKPVDGAGAVTGLVSKVWVDDPKGARRVLAHVRYGNKHEEDLPIENLLPLLKPKRARR